MTRARVSRIGLLVVLVAALASIDCGAQNMRLTVRVILPRSTPSEARITIAGDHTEFGSWDPSVVDLSRRGDSIAERTFDLAPGRRIAFKVTRGTWDTEAIFSVTGEVPGNTVVELQGDTLVTLRPIGWRDNMTRPSSTLTGNTRVFSDVPGEGLRYPRSVVVRLPPSYSTETSRRYPVLYMHDGQNCFDRSTAAFNAEWRADEMMDSLAHVGAIEEVIIVGINNTSDRIAEYSDTPLGQAYAAFVVDKVKPLVDSVYRTLPGPEHTAVMGSSMGGLISFLFTWWYPDVFGKAACLSSVFDRGRTRVIDLVESEHARRPRLRVYMDCGGAPGEVTLKEGMEYMVSVLKTRGYVQGSDFTWFFDPDAEHNEKAWAGRLWRPMEFLFGQDR